MRTFFLPSLILILFQFNMAGQDNDGRPDVFSSRSLLMITIESDFDSLIGDMRGAIVSRPAIISYYGTAKENISQEIRISTRGKFRRRPDNCDFPPLLMDFSENPDTGLFRHLKEVKVVTHCKSANAEFIQYIWGEYLIYDLYSHLTPYAYQVRPVLFTYVNKGTSFQKMNRYGFMLESTNHLEKRLHGKAMKRRDISVNDIDQEAYKRLCFFEYMISNNDWAVSIMHNVKMVRPGKYDLPIPVPYDFDWSGILNIPYKVPGLGKNNTLQPERIFKGEFTNRKELKETVRFYNSKKQELLHVINTLPYLEDSVKSRYLDQVEEFYLTINSPFAMRKKMLKKPAMPAQPEKRKNMSALPTEGNKNPE